MNPKPVSRRLLLMSSAATLGAGVAFTKSGRAAPPDLPEAANFAGDLMANTPANESDLAEIRQRKLRVVRPHNAATLKDTRRNPYFAPIGEPLSKAEQARSRPREASGSGL